MAEKNIPAYEQAYTTEERQLAAHIIGLEKAALDKWFKGDTSGYEKLWSKRSFTYFDASNQCHVQNGTFQPVALHLHQMGVANPHGNGRKDSRSDIIHGIALTIM